MTIDSTAMLLHDPAGYRKGTFDLKQQQLDCLEETVTESFESLNVQKLEDGRYRASIEYLDAGGAKQSHVFEGTRDELRTQIGQSTDLPPMARKHLLNALDMKGGWPMPHFRGPLDFEELMRTWRKGGWMQY